jgi:glutathione S-transferase
VIGVLNDVLKDKKYLVEDKLSYADLSFVTWLALLDKPYFKFSESVCKWKEDEKFAAVKDWLEGLTERDSFKKAMEIQAECGNGKESVRNVQA